MTVIISRHGYGENDELPREVTEAGPGQIVVIPDRGQQYDVYVDGEMIGTVGDESLSRQATGSERGAFVTWAPKQSKRRDGIVDFYPTLEEAAEATVGRPAGPREAHRETYKDVEIVLTFHPAGKRSIGNCSSMSWNDHYTVAIGGRPASFEGHRDRDSLLTKARNSITLDQENAQLVPRLRPLIESRSTKASVADMPALAGAPQTGDTAWVYARGSYRRGLVVAVTRTKATVAYMTASSAERGEVHRKADQFGELLQDN